MQITGVRLGLVLQSISSLGIGLGVAMYYGWKLALVILAFVPFIVFAAMFEMIIIRGASGKNDQRVEKAGEVRICFSLLRRASILWLAY